MYPLMDIRNLQFWLQTFGRAIVKKAVKLYIVEAMINFIHSMAHRTPHRKPQKQNYIKNVFLIDFAYLNLVIIFLNWEFRFLNLNFIFLNLRLKRCRIFILKPV